MKKLTDNEIINDFEKEIKYVRENEKYDDFNPIVDIDLCEDILDLIHRKDAEIERLEKVRQRQAKFLGEERGQKYELLNKIGKAKFEAIKEFAERLKSKRQWDTEFENMIVFDTDIDNILKEMMEVNENE